MENGLGTFFSTQKGFPCMFRRGAAAEERIAVRTIVVFASVRTGSRTIRLAEPEKSYGLTHTLRFSQKKSTPGGGAFLLAKECYFDKMKVIVIY